MESFINLNWLDLVIIVVLIMGILIGLSKGLIGSVLNFAGVFIALIGAKYLTARVSGFIISNTSFLKSIKMVLDKKIATLGTEIFTLFKLFNIQRQANTENLAALFISVVCFIIIFCFIMILINLIIKVLKITVKHTPLIYFDRLGGAAIGLIMAAIFIFIFFAAVTPFTGVLSSDRGLALAIGTSKFARYFYLYNFVIPWLQKIYPVI